MNQMSRDRLYQLLPAIYQLRDAVEGEPLKALLAVIEQEVEAIEEDISDLYDNWFIETCSEWVIPYIGDLLDVRALYASSFPTNQSQTQLSPFERELLDSRSLDPRPYGQQERRAYIANTLAYRRRKGTTPVLEQLVRDVTGWRARAIEFSRLLLTTQSLNHLRPVSATVDLRNTTALDLIGTPFEQQAIYTAEVRRASQGGRYNIPNVGLFVWRLQSYPVERSTARRMPFGLADEPVGRFYTFSPLGYDDVPLFNQPQSATDILKQAQEINLPAALRCAPLARELQARQQFRLQGKPLPSPRYFNDSNPVLQIFVNGQPNAILPEEILIARLAPTEAELMEMTAENQSEADQAQSDSLENNQLWRFPEQDVSIPTKVVAVDPELGRIAFLDRVLPERVEVSYSYGLSDDLGGGPYSRGATKNDLLNHFLKAAPESVTASPTTTWMNPLFWEVEQDSNADANPLDTAIQTWNQTVSDWQALRDQLHVPLARITVPPVQVSRMPSHDIPPRFKPGIVGPGLEVLLGCCATEIVITPGLAIDRQGRSLQVSQLQTVDLKQFDLSAYPNPTGEFILVMVYRAALQRQPYQFALVPETAIANGGYSEGMLIPLAQLKLNPDRELIGQPNLRVRDRLKFQPGIVQGLEVKICPGRLEVIVTPGTAIDQQGNVFVAVKAEKLVLVPYQGVIGSLVVFTTDPIRQLWELRLVPTTVAETESLICLARLDVPRIEADKITVERLPYTVNSDTQSAGIINGLAITLTGSILTVNPGTAQDRQGREIKLEHAYDFDLSPYTAQQFVLFISRQKREGLTLQPMHTSVGQDWQQIGIVPQELDAAATGIILIKDSGTYEGDLEILIPQGKKLKIVAVDGCRPHIAGQIWIQGTAPAAEPDQGELLLEGLLIDGQVTVLPGHLKRLQLVHATLVPEQGGLQVQPPKSPTPCAFDLGDPFAPIAAAMTILALIQDLWLSDLRFGRSPEKHLGQLMQLVLQQISRLLTEIWQVLCPWATQIEENFAPQDDGNCWLETASEEQNLDFQDNSRLEISLYHTICGALVLTATIPKLRIADSIVDQGQPGDDAETSGLAIWAPGTDTEILSTTVLGMTTIRSLEASNSLFVKKVTVQLRQTGCIRFSYVPEGSQTPPRYECQPDRAFQEALDPIPDAITAIAIHTPLVADNISSNSESLHPIMFISSAGGGIFHSIDNGESWNQTSQPANPYVATLLAYEQAGIGKVRIERGQDGKTVVSAVDPKATVFSQQFHPNDLITIAGKTRTVTEVLSDRELTVDQGFDQLTEPSSYPFAIHTVLAGTTGGNIFRSKNQGDGWMPLALPQVTSTVTALCQYQWPLTGTLINAGDHQWIEVSCPLLEAKFQVGDTITVGEQTLLITEIAAQSPQTTALKLNVPIDASQITVTFHVNTILAATAGDGLFRGNTNGENWIPLNQDLSNLDIRAIAVNQDKVWVGTAGDGVFQLIHHPSKDEPGDRWVPFSNDLKNRNVTALAVDSSGIIVVGTAGGGVFYYKTDEKRWIPANQGLTSLDISALVVAGNALVAATTDGKICQLVNRGQLWEAPSLDLEGLDIKALAVGADHHTLFAGTVAGNILRFASIDSGWRSVDTGLPNVLEKRLIMERLQPIFTSTRYGDPGYAQLRQSCDRELRTGAEDGSEMGVFNGLKQPQREANLQANLEEYLRFGLEAGIFYVT